MTTLASYISEKRWREVFLLSVRMLKSADSLLQLMKQQIDSELSRDEKLQQFLAWVEEKSNSVDAPYKKAAVRAYYLVLDRDLAQYLDRDRNLDQDLDRDLAQDLDLALDPAFARYFDLALDRYFARNLDLALDPAFARYLAQNLARYYEDELKCKLQQLKTELPNPRQDSDISEQWWEENDTNCIEQLRAIMIEHRNVGHDWHFTEYQKELLKKYYGANKLLVECLNSDCYVSRDVRKQIEDTLLLPSKSIKQDNQPPALL